MRSILNNAPNFRDHLNYLQQGHLTPHRGYMRLEHAASLRADIGASKQVIAILREVQQAEFHRFV